MPCWEQCRTRRWPGAWGARSVASAQGFAWLEELWATIADRAARRPEGSYTAALLAAGVLPLLALADPAFAIGQILAQIHISGGDTATPMKVGFWRIGFKALLSLALIAPLGIYGLAIATSASSFFRTFELWRRLPRAIRPSGRGLLTTLGGLLVPAVVTAAAVFAAFRWLPAFPWGLAGQVLRAAVIGGAAIALHTGVAWWTGHAIVQQVVARLRRGAGTRPSAGDGLS